MFVSVSARGWRKASVDHGSEVCRRMVDVGMLCRIISGYSGGFG